MPLSMCFVGCLLPGLQLTLKTSLPSETPLEETKFSFASRGVCNQLEMASGLGMGHVSTSFSTRIPSGAGPGESRLSLREFVGILIMLI